MGILKGKKGVILGVGNQRSIAWAVAEHFYQEGAELALTYLKDPKGRFEANVKKPLKIEAESGFEDVDNTDLKVL